MSGQKGLKAGDRGELENASGGKRQTFIGFSGRIFPFFFFVAPADAASVGLTENDRQFSASKIVIDGFRLAEGKEKGQGRMTRPYDTFGK